MDDVPLLVHHDIPVVPVLDLQQVAYQRVGGHALDEVGSSLVGHTERETMSSRNADCRAYQVSIQ